MNLWKLARQFNGYWTIEHANLATNVITNVGLLDMSNASEIKGFESWFADHAQVGDWIAINGEPSFVCLAPASDFPN